MLPTFIIIGAMKSGTTSLHHYLDLHPEIIMSKMKETNFFLEDNYRKGLKWYEGQFIGQAKVYGETSPNYSKYPTLAGIPQRMYSVVLEAKLIYILRDPIDRIISHYMHKCRTDSEKRSIAEVLSNLDDNHYVAASQYYRQLEQYLNYYPRERILILTAEELKTQPQATLKTIFKFLDVDDSFYSPEYARKFNQSSK